MNWLSFGIGIVVGIIIGLIMTYITMRKKSHLLEMKQLIKEASKEIHNGYDKLQTLYKVVEIADRKGRVEK